MLASPDTGRRPESAASAPSPTLVQLPTPRAIRLVGRADSRPAPSAPDDEPRGAGPPDGPLDLRRRRSRAGIDLLLERARFAAPADASLVRAVFGRGVTAGEVARASGLAGPTVRRRLRRVVARLLSARFVFVVSHMGSWPEERRRVAATVVVRGLSARAASVRLGLSLHRVRLEMGRIDAAFEAHERLSRGPGRPWREPGSGGPVIGRIGPSGRQERAP